MMPTNLVGTVLGKNDTQTGYMVEVFVSGQYAVYGPMQFLQTPPFAVDQDLDPYKAGDLVFITNFRVRDQFVIVGKYVDMAPEDPDSVQTDNSDQDRHIDIIEEGL